MRTVIPAIALLILIATASPGRATQSVTGTGTPAQDVQNVQAAVDQGGLVILRGTFNFGPEGRVRISRDTRIQGEADSTGDPLTRIIGGFWTFHSPLPVKGAPPAGKGPLVVVRSIRFEGAKGTPLHFPHVGGLDLRDCTISRVTPQELPVRWSGGDTLRFLAGVVVGNRLDSPGKPLKNAATGAIRIEDNRFDMTTDQPHNTAGYGIVAGGTWGADMVIGGNVIHRASRNGIDVLDNALDAKGHGAIVVENNRIATADTGIEYPHKYGPNGIVAGWYHDTTGGADFARNNRIVLTGNRIEARGDGSSGLLLYANDIVATCNDIIMGGGTEARGIIQTGSRGFFANNRVRGQARYALYCHPFEALSATANTFAWTDLTDFTGLDSQVLLGGTANVLVGTPPMLLDRGQGNRVVMAAPCALPETDPEGEDWEHVGE
jgi:hypothetical protein